MPRYRTVDACVWAAGRGLETVANGAHVATDLLREVVGPLEDGSSVRRRAWAARGGNARMCDPTTGLQRSGLNAITSISTLASTISRASVVERAGRPFGK